MVRTQFLTPGSSILTFTDGRVPSPHTLVPKLEKKYDIDYNLYVS